jgi:site-specific DNA recombinase
MPLPKKPRHEKAVIYTRVSTAAQEDGTSLAAQAVACQKKAEEIGAQVINYYEETMSGGLYLARPGIQQALSDIESAKADTLIIYRLDRTGRDLDGLRDIRRRVERAGGQLVFADGLNFEQNAVGNFMFTQIGAVAELEREMIRDRTTKGLRALAASGKMPARSFAPYGYRIVKKADVIKGEFAPGEEGTYHVIEEQAAVVRLIFEQYLQLPSLRALVGWMAENGYPSPTGKPNWLPASLRQVLTNPVYKGVGVYGRRRHRFDEKRLERGCAIQFSRAAPRDEWTTFPTPAIVSEELWEEANKRLQTGNAQRSGPRGAVPTYQGKGVHKSRYSLTGLVFCPLCGSRMYAMRTSKRNYTDRPHSFGCSRVFPRTAPAKVHHIVEPELPCQTKRFDGSLMERLVIAAVCHLLENPSLVKEAEAHANARRAKKPVTAPDVLTKLEREIKKSREREMAAAQAALDARLKGSDGGVYEELRVQIEQGRQEMEKRLAALQREAKRAELPVPRFERSLAATARRVLRAEDVSPVEKGELLQRLIAKIYPVPIEQSPQKPRNYNLGGVAVVLKSAQTLEEQSEFFILRNVIQSRHERKLGECKIELAVSEKLPFASA